MASIIDLKQRILSNPNNLSDVENYAEKISTDRELMIIVSNHVSSDNASIFLDAATKSGNSTAVENLLIRGANINLTNALEIAAMDNNTYILSLLLKYKVTNKKKINALYKALQYSNLNAINVLLDNMEYVPYNALLMAIEYNDINIIKLIASRVNVNDNGCLALFSAINFLYYDAIKYFLEVGIKGVFMGPAFIAAVRRSDIELARMFLDNGAYINYNNSQAIIEAVNNQDRSMLKFLIDNGIKINMYVNDYALEKGFVLAEIKSQ